MTEILSEEEVFSRIRTAVAAVLNVPESRITREAAFRADLGADSLDLVSLITELEDVFDRRLSDDEAMALLTVGDAVRFIQDTLAQDTLASPAE